MEKRGLFIVLEGLDGSGTTTQAERLAARLRAAGQRAHWTAEPSTGPIGSQIRMILAGRLVGYQGDPWDRRSLALLFAADRLDHLASVIAPRLAAGIHVICDRYVLSSLAYQSLDNPVEWVAELNRHATRPDVTYFLGVPPEVALERRLGATPGRGELFETLPQQQRIAAAYERELRSVGGEHGVKILDGSRPIDVVAAEIWGDVAERIAGLAAQPT